MKCLICVLVYSQVLIAACCTSHLDLTSSGLKLGIKFKLCNTRLTKCSRGHVVIFLMQSRQSPFQGRPCCTKS